MAELLPWQQSIWQQVIARHEQGRLPHALLLNGPEGVGKRQFAEYMSAWFLCSAQQRTPCGQCRSCMLLGHGSHPDRIVIVPEGAQGTIKVDAIRQVSEFSAETAQQGNGKVVLVQNADRLNVQAANALLKNLEEPPARTLFVLWSAHFTRLMPTIRSRCQQLAFSLPATEDSQKWLVQQCVSADQFPQLLNIARGSPLKALEYHEANLLQVWDEWQQQLIGLQAGRVSVSELAELWKNRQTGMILSWLSDWISEAVKQMMGAAHSTTGLFQPELLSAAIATARASEWLAFYEKLNVLRVQLDGTANLNPSLALEMILIEWSRLMRTSSRSRVDGKPVRN
ncbi:DNA polymerase III subunit delta' [Pokkaliibacter plantistimulans]|nr:DNA polymerase III subunit delta' [Pokkaliibacter plantistimulans]